MKIAILSDIHGNLPALQAVADHIAAWCPDHVIVAGDIVNRGPHSAVCWDLIQDKRQSSGWQAMSGNNERYVMAHARPDAEPGSTRLMSYWTFRQMNGRVEQLASLSETLTLVGPDASALRVRHASMLNDYDGIYQDTSDSQARQLITPAPAVFCVGHTHIPFVRRVDDTLVVNAGTVGTPRDGDHRASYAQIEWHTGQWLARITRVEYDLAQAEHDFLTCGLLEQTEPFAHLIFHEWRTAQSIVFLYWQQYQARVKAGELDEATAIPLFLRQNGLI